MAVCKACAALVGRSVGNAPHPDLVRNSAVPRDDGVWETYDCNTCGARAARVIPRTAMPDAVWYVRER